MRRLIDVVLFGAAFSCTCSLAAAQACDPELMAHAERARAYVTSGVDARLAHEEWRRNYDPYRGYTNLRGLASGRPLTRSVCATR